MRTLVFAISYLVAVAVRADGPMDNIPEKVRPVPPPGVEVPAEARTELEEKLKALDVRIQAIRRSKNPSKDLLPDVEIYWRAVHDALAYGEFFTDKEIDAAKKLLQTGMERAEQLVVGQSPWAKQTGLVVRGYVSRIDQSVQPIGLVIPETYTGDKSVRLDIWLHGRGEKLSELAFLQQRSTQVGQISPADTIVLHPYGRYCNANKFAGEIDVLEGMATVQRHYRIDENRIAIRGFSMGGAGCWQMAVHYPDLWFAANPGAGFCETPLFLNIFQKESVTPTPWEKTLWRWYDCPGYAVNLFNCPTIAYSGELDTQKQAADVMAKAMEQEGVPLTYLIGPQTKHAIHPETGKEIEAKLAALAARGREQLPKRVQFATFTLRYNRSHWLTINALEKHWEQARADAQLVNDEFVRIKTTNVSGFSVSFPAAKSPFKANGPVTVEVNGEKIVASPASSDRSWSFHWWRGKNLPGPFPDNNRLIKRHNLQGPIDDAFMDTFIVVRPTGEAIHPAIDKWSRAELDHLTREWRRHFRGHARIKDDSQVTDADIASANLILFGDAKSNRVLSRIASQLPIATTAQEVSAGGKTFDAANHAPVFIYPNPLNPQRYVVVNSGFTFREYDYLNNARQVPRLPDWAIVDIRTPPDSRYPGKITTAGFFDEQWQLAP
jgi:hypothetical protein